MAIDGPSGAYDDDPEQAGDGKPDKDHGHSKQQPAEVRSRAEYYEELRATDKQMAFPCSRGTLRGSNTCGADRAPCARPPTVRPRWSALAG